MSESKTRAMFWAPLSLPKVLVILTVVMVALQLVGVALREKLGLPIPPSAVAGAAGFTGVLIVSALARKQRSDSGAADGG